MYKGLMKTNILPERSTIFCASNLQIPHPTDFQYSAQHTLCYNLWSFTYYYFYYYSTKRTQLSKAHTTPESPMNINNMNVDTPARTTGELDVNVGTSLILSYVVRSRQRLKTQCTTARVPTNKSSIGCSNLIFLGMITIALIASGSISFVESTPVESVKSMHNMKGG
eukprot:scaffold3156_cov268-Chaetoceros_neogracile.AAC.10